MKKTLIVYLSIVLWVLGVTGCYIHREPVQEYHEQVENIERYIVDRLGEFIIIESFDPDVYRHSSANYKGNYALWTIRFREDYIFDEVKTKEMPPVSIVEQVRVLFNQYTNENRDYNLNDYVVKFSFYLPRYKNPPFEEYAVISNWDFENWKPSGRELNTVCMHNPKYNDAYSFPFGDWDYYYKNGGIDVALMDENSTMDQIIEVADNIPDLKYIAVKNQAVADEASKLRPNVKFVGLLGN